jgi:hypothetical protein
MVKDKTLAEEARLIAARGRLQVARAEWSGYGIAIYGAFASVIMGADIAKLDDDDAAKRRSLGS